MARRRERRPLRRPSGPSWVTWANLAMMAVVLVVVVLSRGPVSDAVNSMFDQVASSEGSGEGSGASGTPADGAGSEPVPQQAIAVAHQRVVFAARLATMQLDRPAPDDGVDDP